jgi:ORF6N domain-containing protein
MIIIAAHPPPRVRPLDHPQRVPKARASFFGPAIRRATMAKNIRAALVPVEDISRSILVLRGLKVLLDSELAELYGVATKVLLQAVKRNRERFPDDFMIQLTTGEWSALRSHVVTLKPGRGQHRKYLPYAFTEQGVAMLSSVLRSDRAIAVNIQIMRTFVRMRDLLSSNRELARRLRELETRLEKRLTTHDEAIAAILSAIRQLMKQPPAAPKRRSIGFTADFEAS